jgi:hypothetical protein
MNAAPDLSVEARQVRQVVPGRWRITWHVTDATRDSLALLGARLPHDHFFGQERRFSPELVLQPGAGVVFDVDVDCADPAGTEIENAFLIMRVRGGAQSWLALARLRVRVDENGVPVPVVERVSAQRSGS